MSPSFAKRLDANANVFRTKSFQIFESSLSFLVFSLPLSLYKVHNIRRGVITFPSSARSISPSKERAAKEAVVVGKFSPKTGGRYLAQGGGHSLFLGALDDPVLVACAAAAAAVELLEKFISMFNYLSR